MKNEVFSVRNTDMDVYQFLHFMNLLGMGYQNRSELYTVIYLDDNSVSGLFSTHSMGIVLSYKEAVRLIQKHKKDEIVPTVTTKDNFKPQPRFHKKRKPVPKRKKVDIIINYNDGSSYTIKDVGEMTFAVNIVNIVKVKKIFNSKDGKSFINSYEDTDISSDFINNVLIKTPKGLIFVSKRKENDYVVTDYRLNTKSTTSFVTFDFFLNKLKEE